MSCVYKNFVGFSLWILLVQHLDLTLAIDEHYTQYVPICAPASLVGAPGSPIRGPKGEKGVPGKNGSNESNGSKGYEGLKGLTGFPGGLGECPGVTFHLPRDNQVTDYIRYRDYVPSMKDATACAWVETSDFSDHATVWSYAPSARVNNEFFLAFLNPSTVRIAKSNLLLDFPVTRMTGSKKLHLCTSFSSTSNQVDFYINAERIGVQNRSFSRLIGGGTLLLGQEQDDTNAGRLDANQAFTGNITNFTIWPRILTVQEISYIARKCQCPQDYAVAMTLDKSEMIGEASYTFLKECPTMK